MKDLHGLFKHLLRDMYYVENKLLKALPEMARKAGSPELRAAIERHQGETEDHLANLEEVFELIDLKPSGVTCDAINGILEEGRQMMRECGDPDTCDAGMIAVAQAIEHYEIARYGTLVSWAGTLGLPEAARLLKNNLEQEYAADSTLTTIAEASANPQAAAA